MLTAQTSIKEQAEPSVSDKERIEWCLRYGFARQLGITEDFEYITLTLELMDNAIAREKAKAA